MGELLFNRKARVTLTAPNNPDRVIEGLRVIFQVEKTSSQVDATTPTLNTARVSLFNVNDRTRSYLQQDGARLLLDVGYQGTQPFALFRNIFNGDIQDSKTEKNSGDLITSIECIDGIQAYKTARIERSFQSGSTVKQVFDSFARALGVPLGEIEGIKDDAFLRGYSASGLVRDQLTAITRRTKTAWSIQDGLLTVLPRGSASVRSIIFLTPKTGLIGSPNKIKSEVSGIERQGVQFTSLLQPQISPDRRVQIETKEISGTYSVLRVTHSGDTRMGPWFSSCEAF